MRWAGATVGLGVVIGCSTPSVFTCADDDQCGGGRCEANGSCSFPDSSCASGWAYGELSPPVVAGRCVDEDGGESSSGGSTPPSGSTSTVGSAGTATSADTTVASADTPGYDTPGYDTPGYDTPGYLDPCEAFATFLESCYGTMEEYGEYFLEYCILSYEMSQATGPLCVEAFLEYLACVSALDCMELMTLDACETEMAIQVKTCSQGAG